MGVGEGTGYGHGDGRGFGFGQGCMRCILILVNIFFGFIGFVLLAAGIFIKVGQQYYMPFIEGATNSIPDLIASSGLSGANSKPEDAQVDFDLILGALAIGLIVIGLILFIMGILGCIGACCQVQIIMIIYCVILIVLFICQLVLVILYADGGLSKVLKSQFTTMIENDYVGIDDFGSVSLLLNVCMLQFKCCGANDYTDFATAKKWEKEREFSKEVAGVTYTQKYTLVTPIACCKFDGAFPDISLTNEDCAFFPTDFNNNWKTGCVQSMTDEIQPYQNIIIGVFAGILVFQAILIVFVICLIVLKKKEEKKIA